MHLTITDAAGNHIADLKASTETGLQRLQWDLRGGKEEGGEPALVPAGEYLVKLQLDDQVFTRRLRISGEE
jgi:hypothetical protein